MTEPTQKITFVSTIALKNPSLSHFLCSVPILCSLLEGNATPFHPATFKL